jgi:hypothetical protein
LEWPFAAEEALQITPTLGSARKTQVGIAATPNSFYQPMLELMSHLRVMMGHTTIIAMSWK